MVKILKTRWRQSGGSISEMSAKVGISYEGMEESPLITSHKAYLPEERWRRIYRLRAYRRTGAARCGGSGGFCGKYSDYVV